MKEGDVIDVDTAIQRHGGAPGDRLESEMPAEAVSGSEEEGGTEGDGGDGRVWRRGRVVVKQIGEQTRKGRWHVTLFRHKHFSTIR